MTIDRFAWLLLLLPLTVYAGCHSPDFGRPNWRHPGRIEDQQSRAAVFDPFPDNDGGPEVEGGRPPTYTTPPPDWQRSRNFREGTWRVTP